MTRISIGLTDLFEGRMLDFCVEVTTVICIQFTESAAWLVDPNIWGYSVARTIRQGLKLAREGYPVILHTEYSRRALSHDSAMS